MTSDMVKPSDQWTSFQNLDNESKHAKQIEELLSNADFGYLCSHALAIRREGRSSGVKENQPDGYTCSVDPSKFAYGSYNVAFEVAFSDSVCWIARVRLPYEAEEDAQVEKDMLSEIATMRLVKQKTTVPVPEVFGYDVNGTNALGYRYILMEALPGRVLDSTFSRAIPETHKEKVAGQFAEYFHQLSKLRFDKIGRVWTGTKIDEQPHIISFNMTDGVDGGYTRRTVGPFATSLEYFYTVRQGDNRAVLSKHADEDDWAMACWVLKQALPVMITEDNIHGPFPLCHLDLHFNNILLDDNYNITGIIDWSEAQTVPLERFAISPEFITFPGLTAEENEPIKAFCALFVKALKERERMGTQDAISKQPPMLSDIVGTPMAELVYRCTYSYPWRALSDARLVLRLLYGNEATLETFKAFYRGATVSAQKTCIEAEHPM